MPLERNIPIPLYYQLEDALSRRIEKGEFQPGTLIPTEEQLQQEYGVSRTTVRQAVARLVLAGKLTRIPGRGTFVTEPRYLEKPGLRSIAEDLFTQNIELAVRMVSSSVERPTPKLAKLLELGEDDEVVHLVRVRYAEGEPIFLCDSYLPHRLVPGLRDRELVDGSLYKTLETVYGKSPVDGDEELRASLATAEEAKLLAIKPGAPVLVSRRVTYLTGGQAVEYSRLVFASGRFRYHIRLREADSGVRQGTLG